MTPISNLPKIGAALGALFSFVGLVVVTDLSGICPHLSQLLGETLGGLIAFVCAQLMVITGIYSRWRRERVGWFVGGACCAALGVALSVHSGQLFRLM